MTRDKLAALRRRRTFMSVDAFVGGNGDIVLLQENPDLAGDRFLRIIVHPDDVETLINDLQALRSKFSQRGAA